MVYSSWITLASDKNTMNQKKDPICKKHIFIDSNSKLSKDEVTIAIRRLTISDINEKYCSWMNDKDVNRYLESRLIFGI